MAFHLPLQRQRHAAAAVRGEQPSLLELAGAGSVQATGVIPPGFEGALPEGVTLDSDEELLVVNITEQISAEALEAELAEAEAEAGIEQDEPEEDTTEGAPSDKQLAEGDAPMESQEDGNKED